ncbi:30S ribosomal protein S4 [Terriglobus sp. ADX1]|uniref:30S ribosomal protein S4 n=1 Tax=Terriglobus sp. ADX1 TaxID=2794063 RepID=UPI002FE58714
MARYTGAVCRLCRRDGVKLFLKGSRCFSEKCAIDKRNFPPGQHGQARAKKVVGYGLQLREKQKAKRIYFTLEGQFRSYYEKASNKTGVTGELLLQQLERRLDALVYRAGFALSRRQARQLVRHGHVLVNGKKVNIPSYQIKVGDSVELKEATKKLDIVEGAAQFHAGLAQPTWLQIDREGRTVKVLALPKREEIQIPVNEQLIVELYSK